MPRRAGPGGPRHRPPQLQDGPHGLPAPPLLVLVLALAAPGVSGYCVHGGPGCPPAGAAADPQPVPAPAARKLSGAYDCDAGFSHWKEWWDAGKKDWCCEHAQRGCTSAATMAPARTSTATKTRTLTTTPAHDCTSELSNWKKGWSGMKKEYCCGKRVACVETATTARPTSAARSYRCLVGVASHPTESWPAAERAWCCGHWDSAGIWPPGQREYCCIKLGHGCPPELQKRRRAPKALALSTAKPVWFKEGLTPAETRPAGGDDYNCWLGFQTEWSAEKRTWCCRHRLTCRHTAAAPGDPAGLRATPQPAKAAWSPWAATTRPTTPPTTPPTTTVATPPPSTSTTTPMTMTTTTTTLTTATTSTSPSAATTTWGTRAPFDCTSLASRHARPLGVSTEFEDTRRRWCCEHEQIGCVATTVTSTTTTTFDIHDCKSGASSWESDWSDRKMEWCCSRHRVACRGKVPGRTEQPFHCHANASDLGQGGPKTMPTPAAGTLYCTMGLWDWAFGWSDAKKKWCCDHELGWCPRGYRLEDGWTEERRAWCCQKNGRGCTVYKASVLGPPPTAAPIRSALVPLTDSDGAYGDSGPAGDEAAGPAHQRGGFPVALPAFALAVLAGVAAFVVAGHRRAGTLALNDRDRVHNSAREARNARPARGGCGDLWPPTYFPLVSRTAETGGECPEGARACAVELDHPGGA